MGIRASRPPGLQQVTDTRPAVSAALRLSVPAASPPAPPRCRSEEDALRVRAAAPAAASLQHRLTAASAPGPAPKARVLDHAELTDKRRGQCEGAEAASPAAPLAHLPPLRGPWRPGPRASEPFRASQDHFVQTFRPPNPAGALPSFSVLRILET